VLSEGSGALVLEDADEATRRGATVLGEVLGYGATADAHHLTAPEEHGAGATRAIRLALKSANVDPGDVDYVNAHGTSTPMNDRVETAAIKGVFGEHAARLLISSTKSMIGHTISAAGAIELITAALAVRDQVAPPTINYQVRDPECDLNYVPNVAAPAPIRVAISNSFGFGGHNDCLLVRQVEPSR
jgi:3-oxoacyl-[acyl-carrier-protein] synthase II